MTCENFTQIFQKDFLLQNWTFATSATIRHRTLRRPPKPFGATPRPGTTRNTYPIDSANTSHLKTMRARFSNSKKNLKRGDIWEFRKMRHCAHFLPFVGQVVTFIKKSMNKDTHKTDEADRVFYLFVQDDMKKFWNIPERIPDYLTHRDHRRSATPAYCEPACHQGPAYELGYAPSSSSMEFGATASEMTLTNGHGGRDRGTSGDRMRETHEASWRRPVTRRRNTYTGEPGDPHRGNILSDPLLYCSQQEQHFPPD